MDQGKSREDDPNAKEEVDYEGQKRALLRDTTLGLLIRYLSGYRLLRYPEEKNPEYYKKKYGEEAQNEKQHRVDEANRRSEENWRRENPREAAAEDAQESSAPTLNGSPHREKDEDSNGSDSADESDGRKEKKAHHDEERGKDVNLVEFEPHDAENPMNWSFGKKAFTTGMVCVLTFSIYIGSAIYSPGVTSVMEQFHVSESVAVLGLSAFVAGYGLGPMLWSPLSEIPAIGRNPICKR